MNAHEAIYAALAALDNQDAPLERYPDRVIEALARAGFAVVPVELPPEVLGAAAMHGVAETGNPKHCWDYLLPKVRTGPAGVRDRVTPAHTCANAGTSAGACKTHCGDKERCWGTEP
jgi:hypothetical protein